MSVTFFKPISVASVNSILPRNGLAGSTKTTGPVTGPSYETPANGSSCTLRRQLGFGPSAREGMKSGAIELGRSEERVTQTWARVGEAEEVILDAGQYPHNHMLETTLFILDELGRLPAGVGEVLEIGAGNQRLARLMAEEYGIRVRAVDVKPPVKNIAPLRGAVEFEKASVTNLPLADDSFEAAVASLVIGHVGEDGIAELHRVLRPGGTLMILTHYRDSGLTRWAVENSILMDLILRIDGAKETIEKKDLQLRLIERLDLEKRGSKEVVPPYLWKKVLRYKDTFLDLAKQATAGGLPDVMRRMFEFHVITGNALGQVLKMSREDMAAMFEKHDFEITEAKPLIHTNAMWEAQYLLLGITARKKGGSKPTGALLGSKRKPPDPNDLPGVDIFGDYFVRRNKP